MGLGTQARVPGRAEGAGQLGWYLHPPIHFAPSELKDRDRVRRLGMVRTTKLTVHALLKLLPALSAVEIQEAAERVRLYGQREPIEVLDGQLVAGLSEYLGCLEAKVTPKVTRIKKPTCIVEYVLRRNVPRHLSTLDRACIAVLAQEQYKALGKERMSLGGKLKGRSKEARPFDGERWFESAARMVGTSAGKVKRLAKIRKNAPDVFGAVQTRQLWKLQDAALLALEVREPKDRAEILQKLTAGGKSAVPMARMIWDLKRKASPPLDGPEKGKSYVIHSGPMTREAKKVADKSVDAVYADIVYGNVAMATEVGGLALRVLRSGGVLALINGNAEPLDVLCALRDLGLSLIAVGATHLPDSKISIRGRVDQIDAIPVWFLARKGDRLNVPIRHLHFVSGKKEKDLHPWQKNEAETLSIIRSIASPGSRILDPCCGSGTTGVAALRHGCEFIGIDVDPAAAKTSRGRLAKVDQELGVIGHSDPEDLRPGVRLQETS